MDMLSALVPVLLLLVGLLAGVLMGLAWAARREAAGHDVLAIAGAEQAGIRDGLDQLAERLRDVEHHGVAWQSQLRQQVDDVRLSTDLLRRETGALSTALRRPQVRGRWGELHLRRAVEVAGMVEHCDFTEQVHLREEQQVLRPDMVVHLAGGRDIVVDAKTPLDAQLDAIAAAADDERRRHLQRHAAQVRAHVDALAAKAYWRSLPATPEFVVMFLPAESCLAAALEADPGLVEYAAERDVVPATPTTLIALLRTVAHGWTTAALAANTREIQELGRQLHQRLGVMGGHLDKMGRSLKATVEAYNAGVGSLESRVLVTARQFEDTSVTRQELDAVTPVAVTPRPLTAPELLEAVAPRDDGLDAIAATPARRDQTERGAS